MFGLVDVTEKAKGRYILDGKISHFIREGELVDTCMQVASLTHLPGSEEYSSMSGGLKGSY